MTLEPLLTVDEVATLLGVSVHTVYQLVESGQLPRVDVSSRCYRNPHKPAPMKSRATTRIRPAAVQAFIAARERAATTGVLVEAAAAGRAAADAALDPAPRRPPRPAPRSGPISQLPGADRYVN